jgi:hypothetical protein
MSYAQWHNSYTFFFVHLVIILILVLGFYSCLSGRVRTVYLFSLCVVSVLSSRFTASALVWFSNFLKYFVFHDRLRGLVVRVPGYRSRRPGLDSWRYQIF